MSHGAPLSVCLAVAERAAAAVAAAGVAFESDPLRLDLPPEDVGDDALSPATAAVLGGLYLASEVEQAGAIVVAEALVEHRFSLDVREADAASALERFAATADRWPSAGARADLFARLFGAPRREDVTRAGATTTMANAAFEELLAGYCEAIVAVAEDRPGLRRPAVGLRLAGDRLRRNLAPRQYGNTTLVATRIVQQLRAALDVLDRPGTGVLFGVRGAWSVVRAALVEDPPDIGRHIARGRHGQVVVTSVGHPPVPDSVDRPLIDAAVGWLVATGFDTRVGATR